MPIVKELRLSPKQQEFVEDKHRYTAFFGGKGGGKTYGGAIKAVFYGLKESNAGALIIVTAPTYWTLMTATMKAFFEVMPKECVPRGALKQEPAPHLTLPNGTEYWFMTSHEPRNLQGPSIAAFWMDEEAKQPDNTAWQEMSARLRSPDYECQGWLTSTPDGLNWAYDIFTGGNPNYRYYTASSYDNPFTPKAYRDSIGDNYDAQVLRQEVYGEFVSLSGMVYSQFVESRCLGEPGTKELTTVGGIDFGFNNPSVIEVLARDRDGYHWQRDEFYQSGVTLDDIAAEAHRLKKQYNISRFYCDPTEKQLTESLKRKGLPAVMAFKDVETGIQQVATLLEHDKLKFSPSKSFYVRQQMKTYVRAQVLEGARAKPVKRHDDAVDALRYAALGLRGVQRMREVAWSMR